METIRDITALEELPEAAVTGLRRRNINTQGNGSTNCQGQGAPTCGATCLITSVGGNVNIN